MENEKQKNQRRERDARERALDKTIADSFPTSDPPSTIPDPAPGNPGSAIDDEQSRKK